MAHLHSIHDTDLHFIIDPITRRISSESGKVTLMQKDHNSERFTFEIPRYIEGHDMSLTDVVQIHYNNIEAVSPKRQNKDIYPAIDLQISPDSDDVVIFSWLISGNATQYVGSLNFIVRFVCYDDNSDITYQWWSDTYTQIKIAATMDNTDEAVDLDDSDILESWRQECIRAVFESEVFSTLEAQGSNYVERARAYAEQAKQVSGLDTVESLLDDIQTTSKANLGAAGWYRVAEYNGEGNAAAANGSRGNSCLLAIKASYINTNNETHLVLYSLTYKKTTIKPIMSQINGSGIKKTRVTVDGDKAYLEVYYGLNVANTVSFTVMMAPDYNCSWKAIPPVFTEETVDGVTVNATCDLTSDVNPLTDADLVQFEGTEYLETSVLEKAVLVSIGVHQFRLKGDSYTGNDLPHGNYRYGNATIYKRSGSAINVMLWGANSARPIAKNDYNGTEWSGWQIYATTDDLLNVDAVLLNGLHANEIADGTNLLINSDFRNPVNSSGKTSWNAIGALINGWKMNTANMLAELTDNGIKISSNRTGGTEWFMSNDLTYATDVATSYTFSARVRKSREDLAVRFTIYGSKGNKIWLPATTEWQTVSATVSTTSITALGFVTDSGLAVGDWIEIEWAKLELGSIATPFIPPNKEVEKLKCGIVDFQVNKTSTDLNNEFSLTNGISVVDYVGTTLNTPYTEGLTTAQQGRCITSVPNSTATFAFQIALPDGGGNAFVRRLSSGNLNEWKNISDGGNADTVDGKHAKEFRLAQAITWTPTEGETLLEYISGRIADGYMSGTIHIFGGVRPSDVPTVFGVYSLCNYQKHNDNYVHVELTVDGTLHTEWAKFNYANKAWVSAFSTVFLPLDGSVPMTGAMRFGGGYGRLNGANYWSSLQSWQTNDGTLKNGRALQINNAGHTGGYSDITKGLIFVDCVEGKETYYPVLHTGNMANYVLPLDGSVPMSGTVEIDTGYDATTRVIQYDGMTFIRNRVSETDYTDINLTKTNVLFKKRTSTGIEEYDMLHTGNSQKVSISDTAPTDGLWVVP